MSRLIDADYLLGTYQALCSALSCEECRAKYKDGTCKVEHWLKAQLTIDAVEVIRCKDCEYGEQDEDGRWYCRSFGCQVGDADGNGFCADAERRRK